MASSTENHHLVLRVGQAYLALPAEHIREIVDVPRVTALPGQPRFVRGLIMINHEVVPVVDVTRALDLPADEGGPGEGVRRDRLVVLGDGARLLGIVTPRVVGLLGLEDEKQAGTEILPPSLGEISEKAVMGLDGWVAVTTFDRIFESLRQLVIGEN